jgi:LPS export ABC transporter protein LptC
LILTAIAVISMLFACSQTEEPSGGSSKPMRLPDSILEKATIAMTTAGKRQALIAADTLFVFEREDSTTAVNVQVDFYNDMGEYQSTLTAKRGLVRQKQQMFSVWGDVVVENDSARIDTQSLYWDSKRNLVTTEDFVKFKRRGDVVSGYGLEADSKLENVRILRDVKGRITDMPGSEEELNELDNPAEDKTGQPEETP